MSDIIIPIESYMTEYKKDLKILLKLIPPKQRNDIDLQRLILFRLKLDQFDRTRAYLVDRIRAADRCKFEGRLYDYLKDDTVDNQCKPDP